VVKSVGGPGPSGPLYGKFFFLLSDGRRVSATRAVTRADFRESVEMPGQ